MLPCSALALIFAATLCVSQAAPDGEVRVFVGRGSCPPGWGEVNFTQGHVLVSRPAQGKVGWTNGEPPMAPNETGRIGPHGHGVTDPIHGKQMCLGDMV